MNEVEAVKAAIANTTDFDGDRMASRYADSELHAVALAAIAALDAARGDQVARVEALSDNAELLTIAWMDGSHRSTKAHRARIAELEAEVERLREALGDIVNPLAAMQRRAEVEGRRLSGMAYSIATDLGFVQNIARAALGARNDADA